LKLNTNGPSPTLKKNVDEFNHDIASNAGYRYTTNAPYSSQVANRRISKAIEAICAEIMSSIKTGIDIGCGDGTYTLELERHFPAIDWTGFDPAAEAIELGRKKTTRTQFLVGNILDEKSFPKNKYDIGIVRGVLHHLSTQMLAIANAGLLSNRIIIIEPNGNNPILKYLEKNSKYHIEHEEQSFSSRQLKKWCEKSGFKILKTNFIGFVPFFFPTPLARMIYFFQPLFEKIPYLAHFLGAQIVLVLEKKAT